MSLRKIAPWFILVGILYGFYFAGSEYRSNQAKESKSTAVSKVLPRSPIKQYASPIPKAPDGIVYRREKALEQGKNALTINIPAECGLQGVEFIKVDLYSRTQEGKYSIENGKCEVYEFAFDWLTNEIEQKALDAAKGQ